VAHAVSPVQRQYLDYVLEQLAALGALRSNRMFGGVGLYADGLFFGLIDDDTLFFKTDETNIADYRERNMPRFMPFPERPEAALGYHQVPADVIEDAETLVAWARKSVAVALAAHAAKANRKPKKPAAKRRARVSRPVKAVKKRAKAVGRAKAAKQSKRAQVVRRVKARK
jgi:DNA transformation protein